MRGSTWTKEEIEYLDEKWGQVSIPGIAKHLGRSVNAVKLKAQRIGLKRHIHSGIEITLHQFSKAVGKSYGSMRTHWVRLGLPVKYKKSINKKFAVIDIDKFWKWAEEHKDIVDFSAFEVGTFGKEPKWVKEARSASYSAKRNTAPWTEAETQKLEFMLNAYNYNYGDIARELNRTENAVKRHIFDLGLKQRPLRAENRKWTEADVRVLIDMRGAGYCWEDIGVKLRRTGQAVRGKYERIMNPDYGKQYRRRQRVFGDHFQMEMCSHYYKVKGCELGGCDCDACVHFKRRDESEQAESGWNKLHGDIEKEILRTVI